MIEFVPFKADHLWQFVPQDVQRDDHRAALSDGSAVYLESTLSFSGFAGVRCVGAAGLVPVRPHRAVAWLILSDRAGPYMLPLARKVRRVFALAPYRRIEFTVAAEFEAGHRFADLIGAKCETPDGMEAFGPTGGAEMMYSVVRG